MTFVSGFASMNSLQPPPFSSSRQLEHQLAQKCTTVTRDDFVASATCASIGSGSAAHNARPVNNRRRRWRPDFMRAPQG
jgi:hypothetical protein